MFFIGIFGTDSKVVPLGQISPLVCRFVGQQLLCTCADGINISIFSFCRW